MVLCCSQWQALNSASRYILSISCPLLFCISLIAIFIAVILAVWMDAYCGIAPLLVMAVNTAAKPTFFLGSLIHQCRLPWYYCNFLCVLRSAVFSCCHSTCVFLLHSRIIGCLPTMGVAMPGLSLLSPSILSYIFAPVFLDTLP